jgi:hypothetical protein
VQKYVDPSRLSFQARGSVSSAGMSTPATTAGSTFSVGRLLLGILLSALIFLGWVAGPIVFFGARVAG